MYIQHRSLVNPKEYVDLQKGQQYKDTNNNSTISFPCSTFYNLFLKDCHPYVLPYISRMLRFHIYNSQEYKLSNLPSHKWTNRA